MNRLWQVKLGGWLVFIVAPPHSSLDDIELAARTALEASGNAHNVAGITLTSMELFHTAVGVMT